MKFGPVAVMEAAGAVLAHAYATEDRQLAKGHRLTQADCTALAGYGHDTVIVARAEPGDHGEDEAASLLARSLRLDGIVARPAGTGRVNLHASCRGLFTVEPMAVHAFNRIDPAITLATLAPHARVDAGQMVATIKIIPFAVPAHDVAQAGALELGMGVKPFRPGHAALIQTVLPATKPGVLDKTRRVTEARLEALGQTLTSEARTDHNAVALRDAILKATSCDLVVIFGASAVADPEDVIPAAIRFAGGHVERVGMPVDPGNLLVLGSVGPATVIGAPGCARSPKENGFDWVLARCAAGLPPCSADIAAMGVGGLLMEIPSRPRPRGDG